jgi:hypothetical protein
VSREQTLLCLAVPRRALPVYNGCGLFDCNPLQLKAGWRTPPCALPSAAGATFSWTSRGGRRGNRS